MFFFSFFFLRNRTQNVHFEQFGTWIFFVILIKKPHLTREHNNFVYITEKRNEKRKNEKKWKCYLYFINLCFLVTVLIRRQIRFEWLQNRG